MQHKHTGFDLDGVHEIGQTRSALMYALGVRLGSMYVFMNRMELRGYGALARAMIGTRPDTQAARQLSEEDKEEQYAPAWMEIEMWFMLILM